MTDKNWTGDFKPRKGNTKTHRAYAEMAAGSTLLPVERPGTSGPRLAGIEARLKDLEAEVIGLRVRVGVLEEELDD